MSFFQASTKKEDVQQGGSGHLTKSGIYPISLLAAIANASKNGSTTVDMFVEHEGQKQIIYGNLRITNNDGTPNKIGSKIFNQLVIIAGLDSVADPNEMEVPIGKNGAMKNSAVLEDLSDIDVLMRIQMEYSMFKGEIQEKKIIKSFFRASDNATAEEIVNGGEVGKGYEAELKYKDHVTYKDELTPEQVTAWIAAGRKGSGGGSGDSPKKEAPKFGEKRRFGTNKD
jgi:hypothetical protein